jgi:hypothetical protein
MFISFSDINTLKMITCCKSRELRNCIQGRVMEMTGRTRSEGLWNQG